MYFLWLYDMKKIGLLIGCAMFFLIGIWLVRSSKSEGDVKSVSVQYEPAKKPTQPTAQQETALPTTLSIPSLSINAPIEPVGLDSKKRMDVPQDDMNIGWYTLGARPGELGSAVLAGHYDTKNGTPAVFYTLSAMKIGDEINVVDEKNNILTFVVTETQTVKDASFPLEEVFARTDKKRLNLITCAGTYNDDRSAYDERFIVYSVLKEH
jgi:sortase A